MRDIHRETERDAPNEERDRERERDSVCVSEREGKEGVTESTEGVRMMKTKRE